MQIDSLLEHFSDFNVENFVANVIAFLKSYERMSLIITVFNKIVQ